MRSKNHKLNRAVQAMLFSMVERGMEGEVVGDKGKLRASAGPTTDRTAHNGEEAMWAVILTKELWKKGIWSAFAYNGISYQRLFDSSSKVRRKIRFNHCFGLLPSCNKGSKRCCSLLPRRRGRERGERRRRRSQCPLFDYHRPLTVI